MSIIPKNRLESFSDGVLAIIITIMVLDMRAPHGTDLAALRPLVPVFLSYIISFAYIGIYWSNHHHLLHAAHRIDGRIMWANLHLLFWLSLIPFATDWLDENRGEAWPTALYGAVLFCSGAAYMLLQHFIINVEGRDSKLASAIGKDWKGKISLVCYAAAVGFAFVDQRLSHALYVLVAIMWFAPDLRIEKTLK